MSPRLSSSTQPNGPAAWCPHTKQQPGLHLGERGTKGWFLDPRAVRSRNSFPEWEQKPCLLSGGWRLMAQGPSQVSATATGPTSGRSQDQTHQPQQCCLAELQAFSLPQHARDLYSACLCKCAEHIKELKVRGAEKERRKPFAYLHCSPTPCEGTSWNQLLVPS